MERARQDYAERTPSPKRNPKPGPIQRSDSFTVQIYEEEPKDEVIEQRVARSASEATRNTNTSLYDEHKSLVGKISTMEGVLQRNNEQIQEN